MGMGDEAAAGRRGETELAAWLIRLDVARRLRRFYPADHPAVAPALRALEEAAAVLPRETLVLEVSPHGFRLGRAALGLAAERTRRLALQLFQLGVIAVAVRAPLASSDLACLVEVVASLKDSPSEEDRRRALADSGGLTGIELVPLDVSAFVFAEGLAARSGATAGRLWQELVARLTGGVLAGQGPLSPADVARLVAEAGDPQGFLRLVVDRLMALLAECELHAELLDGLALLGAVEELIRALSPELTGAAARLMLQQAEPPGSLKGRLPEVLSVETFLSGVAAMIAGGDQLPQAVRDLLLHLARPEQPPRDPWRARGMQVRPEWLEQAAELLRAAGESARQAGTAIAPFAEHPELHRLAAEAGPERSLAAALDDAALRRHFEQVLRAAYQLWPDLDLGKTAGKRLVERYFEHLELGELAAAAALATELVGRGGPGVVELVAGPRGVDALLEAVWEWGKERWTELLVTVAAVGEQLAPGVVGKLKEEGDLSRRRRLMEIILAIGPPAIPHLRPLVADRRWYVVRNAFGLLRSLGDPEVVPLARTLVRHAALQVAVEAVQVLLDIDDPAAPQALRLLDARNDPKARRLLRGLCARSRHPELGRLLVADLRARRGARLRDPDTVELVNVLAGFDLPEVEEELRRLAALPQWPLGARLVPLWRAVARAAARRPGPLAEEVLGRLASMKNAAGREAQALLARRRGGGP